MKRLNIMLPEDDYEWLYGHAESKDVSVAEVLRRAVSYWIKMDGDPYAVLFGGDPFDAPDPRLSHKLPIEIVERLDRLEKLLEMLLPEGDLARAKRTQWSGTATNVADKGNAGAREE